MDIQEDSIYKSMCQKATEIQKIKNTFTPKDFWFSVSGKRPGVINNIWLPRQDQLQELIGADLIKDLAFHTLDSASLPYNRLLSLWAWVDSVEAFSYSEQFMSTSLEALWLGFVMDLKYGKRWNGDDWIAKADKPEGE